MHHEVKPFGSFSFTYIPFFQINQYSFDTVFFNRYPDNRNKFSYLLDDSSLTTWVFLAANTKRLIFWSVNEFIAFLNFTRSFPDSLLPLVKVTINFNVFGLVKLVLNKLAAASMAPPILVLLKWLGNIEPFDKYFVGPALLKKIKKWYKVPVQKLILRKKIFLHFCNVHYLWCHW